MSPIKAGVPAATAAGATASVANMTLPTLIFGAVEVRRLSRELETLDEYAAQARLRKAAGPEGEAPTLPRTSRLLETLARENHCDLGKAADRQVLAKFIQYLVASAPQLHISFATDPSANFTVKIVTWLRGHIHPHTLLQLGLQPSIAAGCIIRTNNKSIDLSLRNRFDKQRDLLTKALEGKL